MQAYEEHLAEGASACIIKSLRFALAETAANSSPAPFPNPRTHPSRAGTILYPSYLDPRQSLIVSDTSSPSHEANPPEEEAGLRAARIDQLFRQHNATLVSFLTARLRSEAEAHEVAQEAYVRMLQLEHPGVVSFQRAYLFKVAANLAIDRLRQRTADAAPSTLSTEVVRELERVSARRLCTAAALLHVMRKLDDERSGVSTCRNIRPRQPSHFSSGWKTVVPIFSRSLTCMRM